jgi:hypothetical protein
MKFTFTITILKTAPNKGFRKRIVCVCVCERERERERFGLRVKETQEHKFHYTHYSQAGLSHTKNIANHSVFSKLERGWTSFCKKKIVLSALHHVSTELTENEKRMRTAQKLNGKPDSTDSWETSGEGGGRQRKYIMGVKRKGTVWIGLGWLMIGSDHRFLWKA